jgi:cellulose synthase/poly-beta-1,6-N-acetylglucosamine synthase-like glycosyltransferase
VVAGTPIPVLSLDALLALSGLAAVAATGYLLSLAVAALFYREGGEEEPGVPVRVAVLVPAHNEAELISRSVESLMAQDYPKEHYDVIVIADNCTDTTAALAARAGARVLVRVAPEARGKGRALRWAMDLLLADPCGYAAVAIVDADSIADRHLLRGLVDELAKGAEAVQGQYLALPDEDSTPARLRAAAFLLFHRTRFAGRAVLGLPCSLVGNGMLLSRQVLESHPWTAFSGAEDLEYSLDLRLAGVRPRFAARALVSGPVSGSGRGADVQRQRWEGGRARALRTHLPRLMAAIVRDRRGSVADAAVDLAVPPLGLLALMCLSGGALSVGLWLVGGSASAVVPWGVSVLALVGYVIIGLAAAGATMRTYGDLLAAPVFLARKAVGTVAVLRASRHDTWIRTERPSERGA